MSSNRQHRKNSASTDRLPPIVYLAFVGFVAWMVLAAWGFAGPDYADVALTVVTGLLAIVIAIPFILWRVSRANQDHSEDERSPDFAEWCSGQFETWQDRVKDRAPHWKSSCRSPRRRSG